mmetsp:Transcript_34045/g.71635  ORF Transcript_34045/g.71635 Transcript_34045/m.71635 type:complete len:568 (-) Transcript_34045:262-1965(-)
MKDRCCFAIHFSLAVALVALGVTESAAAFTISPGKVTIEALWGDPSKGKQRATSLSLSSEHRTNTLPLLKETPETNGENIFLREALLQNALFTKLSNDTFNKLISTFDTIELAKDQVIMQQGDPSEGGFVYVVADGECSVMVDGKIVPEPYGTLKARSIIGELGVLDNKARAATISTKTDKVKLYRIDGANFKTILNRGMEDAEQLEKIDDVLKQITGSKSMFGGDIILPYKPDRFWLWSRWDGTILNCSIRSTLFNMLTSLVFILVMRRLTDSSLKFGMAPDKSHPLIARLDIINRIWSYQTSLTTFILTFFVNQAYGFWNKVHSIARRIQGRMNDLNLLLATSVKRKEDGTYTPESLQLLDDVAAYSRLFHTLFWASYARRFDVLLTDQGLERMATRGLMTSNQLKILQNVDLPKNQRHNACLEWMIERAFRGIDDGIVRNYEGSTSKSLQQTMLTLRATFATTGDALSTRMHLAYTHLVQILVDSYVFTAPFALYSTLGDLSFICVGIISLFYTGLMNLAKIFLDPLGNENFSGNSLDMDISVLIRQSNGGSTRWKEGGATLPF